AGTPQPRRRAGRRSARVRAIRPREGAGRARRPVPPRPAQRRDPDPDGARSADRLHARRRHRGGNDLHAARRGSHDARRRAGTQLSRGAEHGAGHRRDVHARQPRHRHSLRRRRSASATAMSAVAGLRRARLALAGLGIVVVLAVAAVLAPLLPLGSPTDISKDLALRGPTAAEPFGRDDLGRSLLSRVIHAYRVSLGVAITAALLAVIVGGPLGLIAGYAEGLPDQLIMRPLDVLMAFPAVLLASALMSVFGSGAMLLSIALGIVYTPVIARVARAAVLATKVEVYVDGARALGATVPRLVMGHILPNAAAPMLVQASVLMA